MSANPKLVAWFVVVLFLAALFWLGGCSTLPAESGSSTIETAHYASPLYYVARVRNGTRGTTDVAIAGELEFGSWQAPSDAACIVYEWEGVQRMTCRWPELSGGSKREPYVRRSFEP